MASLSFKTVPLLCSKLDLSGKRIPIDLSSFDFIEPFALIYLGLLMRYFNCRGKVFSLILPEDSKVQEYLSNQNFFERFKFDADTIENNRLLQELTATSLNDIIDIIKTPGIAENISDKVKSLLVSCKFGGDINEICILVAEVVDNFAQHSGETLGVFMVQYFPKLKKLSIAIGDCGIGFRASLCKNRDYAYLEKMPHYRAIAKAFEPLVSCIPGRGMGLSELRDEIIKSRGYLYCSSFDGYVRIDKKGKMYEGKMPFSLPGVKMEFGFPEKRV